MSTKKKPAFIKIAVDDETARNIMNGKTHASFLLSFEGDKLNEIASEIDSQSLQNRPKDSETTELPSEATAV